ncbi:DUF2442 domain-containing protein [Novosphingobium lubricantis]
MRITEDETAQAGKRMATLREAGHAVSARYDRRRARVVVGLNTGVELTFPAHLAEGLADASPDSLAVIEISPAGLGLHWPKLDADIYVPGLLRGVFGSKNGWPTSLDPRAERYGPRRRMPRRAPMAKRVVNRESWLMPPIRSRLRMLQVQASSPTRIAFKLWARIAITPEPTGFRRHALCCF